MKARVYLVALAVVAASHADLYGLTPPSSSDGPVKLLACVVSASGVLEAEVDSQSTDPMNCNIRCNYELGGHTFSHWFNLTIPAQFNGRVGRFDTGSGTAGQYSGEIGTCKKTAAHGD